MLNIKYKELGEHLVEARERKGWSKAKVARDMGCSWDTVHKWEKGERRPLSETLLKLCEYYEVDQHVTLNIAFGEHSKKEQAGDEINTRGGEENDIPCEFAAACLALKGDQSSADIIRDIFYIKENDHREFVLLVAEIYKCANKIKEAHGGRMKQISTRGVQKWDGVTMDEKESQLTVVGGEKARRSRT